MNRSRMIGLIIVMVLSALAVFLAVRMVINIRQNVSALQKEQQVVYDVWANSLEHYTNVFYPQSVDTIYLFSGTSNVLLPKLTQVYYWPLTLEYRADWNSMNRKLTGIFEILSNGRLVQEIEPADYALVYDGITPQEVVFGEQAQVEYEKFILDSRSVADESAAYYIASIDYQVAYEKYLDEVKAGNVNAIRPEPLGVEPPQIDYYVSKPETGFVINLPQGEYQIRLKLKDGRVVEGTEKQLKIFAPRREGIGYLVFAEDRWTKPEVAANPQVGIYTLPNVILFLQPYSAFEVESYNYSRLLSPQQPLMVQNTWEWVLADPKADVEMQVTVDSGSHSILNYDPYRVEQTPGSRLGYSIIPFNPEEMDEQSPTFSAFRLDVGARPSSIRIEVMDQDGQVLRTSVRKIEKVREINSTLIYMLSVLPLLLGSLVMGWRRVRMHRKLR